MLNMESRNLYNISQLKTITISTVNFRLIGWSNKKRKQGHFYSIAQYLQVIKELEIFSAEEVKRSLRCCGLEI